MRRLLVCVLMLLPVAASAESRAVVARINYQLRRYVHPTHQCAGMDERMATMYGNGDGNVGKPTACGGPLDRHRHTVAHRTLPCGTRLTIRNPRNGRQVAAVVGDRGPYTVASLDLGPAVYTALGMHTSAYVCVSRDNLARD